MSRQDGVQRRRGFVVRTVIASSTTSSAVPVCRRVCKIANDCQLTMDADEYVNSFSPTIMDLVAAWAQGARFLDILKSSGILEVRGAAWDFGGHLVVDPLLHHSGVCPFLITMFAGFHCSSNPPP